MEEDFDHVVYSKNVIEFVTVANEYCQLLENVVSESREDFVNKMLKMTPLLYLKTVVLPKVEPLLDLPVEKTVTEFDYYGVHDAVMQNLGKHNDYLEVFSPEMDRSEGALAASVAEDLADIYQDVKDFLASYQIGVTEIMNDALLEVITNFELHWGQRLVNCLRAFHNIYYSEEGVGDEEEDVNNTSERESNRTVNRGFYNRIQDDYAADNENEII